MTRKWFVRSMTIVMMIACSGCIFEPRTPEPPSGEDKYPWIVPNLPKTVFHNLSTGLASNTDSNYERSLDATFTFHPTAQDSINLGPEKFAGWTKAVELDWLVRVKTLDVGARTIQFGDAKGNFPYEDEEAQSATYEGPYKMVLVGAAQDTFAGIARFTLTRGTQGWMMTRWTDIEASESYATSGYLRGTLRATR